MVGAPQRVGAKRGLGARVAVLGVLILLGVAACMSGPALPSSSPAAQPSEPAVIGTPAALPVPSPDPDSARLLQTFVSAATTSDALATVRVIAAEPHRLTPELARSIAAWMLGPLPETRAPDVPLPHPSATLGIRLLLRFWDDHTPEQRASFLALLDLTGGRASTVAALGPVALELDLDQLALDRQVREIADEIATLLGEPSIAGAIKLEVVESLTRASGDATPIGRDGIASGQFVECRIRIEEGNDGRGLQALLVHEVMHCYQYALGPTVEAALDAPPWVAEGSATWAEAVIVGPLPAYESLWSEYLHDERRLALRVYDAFGFWAQLDAEPAVDVWSELGGIFREATDASDAFDLVVPLGGPAFAARWASGRAMRPTVGPDWAFTAPGRTDTGSVLFLVVPDGPRSREQLAALRDEPRVRQVHTPAESVSVLVEATTDRLIGRVASADGSLDQQLGEADVTRYCVGPRCECLSFAAVDPDLTLVGGTDLFVALVGSDRSTPGTLTLELTDPYAPSIESAICQAVAPGIIYVGPCLEADPVGAAANFWCSRAMSETDSTADYELYEATDLTVSGEFGTDVCVFLSLVRIEDTGQWRVDGTSDCFGIESPD